ncbi:hypothetical protein M407DRAFT_244765 [Tulasnella calospora MUT 4182]|uniref:Uncharacterized protein n=1 Tax=Tulasnella calospora MUT 4182 TaxID=1051891 RepID=A0A0C3KQ20_9AGAM|nr:hypothetical protein M407DRAFT_244765 [Tulasnella calospora MUT 4182]
MAKSSSNRSPSTDKPRKRDRFMDFIRRHTPHFHGPQHHHEHPRVDPTIQYTESPRTSLEEHRNDPIPAAVKAQSGANADTAGLAKTGGDGHPMSS